MRRIASLIAVVASLAAAAGPAQVVAAGPQWARVNVCAADSVGVRASQSGDAFDRPMFTRFGIQWFDTVRKTWQPLAGAGSQWIAAGSGPWLARETGWTQSFVPQTAGPGALVRGVVEMQWRSESGAAASAATLVTPQTCTVR